MHVAALLVDTTAQAAAVVGTYPVHQVFVGRSRVKVNRAVYTSMDPKFDTPGSFEFVAPLTIQLGDKRIPNPGLAGVGENSHVWIRRNGTRHIASGFVDKEPSIDLATGYARFTCKDSPADTESTVIGHGSNSDPDPEVPAPDDTFMLTGWGAANADVAETTSPWGDAVSVGYGDEKKNPWFFGFVAITVSGKDTLQLDGLLNMEPGKSRQKVITLSQRFLDKPKKAFITTVEIPDGIASGSWQEISLPTLTSSEGRSALWDLALWAPVGGGTHQLAVRGKWNREQDPDDPDVPAIKVGGGAVDMRARLEAMCASQAGGWWFVQNNGGGLFFEDGAQIDPTDTGTFASHIGTFSPSTEGRWDPSSDTDTIGAAGTLGTSWPIRASVQGRAQVTGIDGSSGKVRWTTVTGTDGESTRAVTFDAGSTGGHDHDLVLSAPQNVDFYTYVTTVGETNSNPGQAMTLALPAPPGGVTPGEWLDWGMLPGDRVFVNVTEGSYSGTTLQRITGLHHDPLGGDTLVATVEPIP